MDAESKRTVLSFESVAEFNAERTGYTMTISKY
jgi:hypothetical protein